MDFPENFQHLLEHLQPKRPGPWLRYRKGGSALAWGSPGATQFSPAHGWLQCGAARWTGAAALSGALLVNLPAAYAAQPLVLVTAVQTIPLFKDIRCQCSANPSYLEIYWFCSVALTEASFHWLTLGAG